MSLARAQISGGRANDRFVTCCFIPCTASKLIALCPTWGSYDQLRRLVVLVDNAVEHLAPLNRQVQRRAGLAVLVGRPLLAGLVRAVPVVVAGVLAEDWPQVPFAVDDRPVGALGSCAAYPSLGITVRTRRPRRGLDCLHALAGEDRVEGAGEL